MKGTINQRKDTGKYYIQWYDPKNKKPAIISRYNGETMESKAVAHKLLAQMQYAVDNGTFILEKYQKKGWTDTIPFIKEWIEAVRPTLSPATYKGYKSYLKNHIMPYFKEHSNILLHDIQLDVITDFMNQLPLKPKGKMNIVYCLHTILDYAKRSRRIAEMPSFPKKSAYQLIEKKINWLREKEQLAVLEMIPEDHQPIFYFLKFSMRRPAEGCALHKIDFENEIFTIRRSISARKLTEKTKTGDIHFVPCLSEFKKYINIERKKQMRHGINSKFFFVNLHARKDSKRYTNESLNIIWKEACIKAGIKIPMYSCFLQPKIDPLL